MQILHKTFSKYKPTKIYDLDVIISVGYRVKSKRGTQFRIWARKVLKDYLVKGFAVNERMRRDQIGELRQLVQVVGRTLQQQPLLKNEENQALFDIVVDYTYALDTLDDYDYQRLVVSGTTQEDKFHATYENANRAIQSLRKSLVAAHCSATRKTTRSRAVSVKYTKLLEVRNCTPAWRRKLPCYSI